ncbi:MAG: ATP-binding protein [Actinobacteria bacterium]|nr:ATP-binding protein [Actinomycetota bacterium]
MQGTQELEREIWLRADPASASVARAFVAQAAETLHYDRAATEALRLGTTEAVANAIEHGAPCEDSLISVSVYLEAGYLTIEVGDCGDFQAARQSTNGLDERGRGLPLMFAVMDHVEIDTVPGRTVVRLAKRLPVKWA